ncbi:19737_t:CDS:2, partial [Gigaspora rosea]
MGSEGEQLVKQISLKPKRREKNFNSTTRAEALGLKKRKRIESDYLTKAKKKMAKLQESRAETL